MNTSKLKIFYVLLFCISLFHFYDFYLIPDSIRYYVYYILFLLTFIIVVFTLKKSDLNIYVFPLMLLLTGFLFSAINSYKYWNQDVIDSFKSLTFPLSYILFFLMLNFRINKNDVERMIVILGILYMIIYSIALIVYPVMIFEGIGHWGNERGFQRISIRGLGFLFLLSFYSVKKYDESKKNKWLLMMILTLIFIVLKLSRTLMFFSFIMLILYLLRESTARKKLLSLLFIGLFAFMITQFPFFDSLVKETKMQTERWDRDVRYFSAKYYIDLSNRAPGIVKIFGNGVPYSKSYFSSQINRIERAYGYYTVDIGYIGIYFHFGLWAVLILIILFSKTIIIDSSGNYYYVKYFLYFLFLTDIIIPVFIGYDFIPAIVFSLYLLSDTQANE